MKILQIHNYYKSRGGEASVVNAEKDLLESKGDEVVQLFSDNIYLKEIFREKKRFYYLLDKVIEEVKPDVAHIHNIFQIIGPEIFKYLHKRNMPVVMTIHNYRFLCPNGLFLDNDYKTCELCSKGNFFHAIRKRCYQHSMLKSLIMSYQVKKAKKEALKYVDKFIVLTEFTYKKYKAAGFSEKKLAIKPNFIDVPKQEHKKQSSSTDEKYALYMGRISFEKGLDNLVKAFKSIPLKLKIAGSGAYEEELKALAKNNDNIKLVGYVDGITKERLIKNCSFFIFSSKCYENFPVSILEANKYKKPVIASNLGGVPGIVKDKETGLVYDINNPQDLKEKVIWAMEHEDDMKIMGENGFKRLQEHYSAEANYNMLMHIYNEVISTKKQ